jgi:hypothetical protein
MQKISRYIFISLLSTALVFPLKAQIKEDLKKKEDKPAFKQSGLSLGVDIMPVAIRVADKDRIGIGFNGRLNIKEKIFAVGELGYENVNFTRDKLMADNQLAYQFKYKSNGTYLKLGFDYNIFKVDETDNHDNVLIGIRYGYSLQQHESPGYVIGNSYWDDYIGSAGSSSVSSHWGELLFGLRTEVLKNLHMGWSVRLKRIIYQSKGSTLEPAVIPGFGRFNNMLTAGFTYSIEYQIPFNKSPKH